MKSFHQGYKGETMEQEGLQGGATFLAGHTPWGAPMRASQSIHVIPRSFKQKPKRMAFQQISKKLIFTIHDDIFQRLIELKKFMWA